MRRRALLSGLCAGLGVASAGAGPAAAQLGSMLGRPGVSGNRAGVDEALRRTVTLVLRAESRREPLPPSLTDPQPLSDELAAMLVVGERLPDDFPAAPVPPSINRRLPHARGSTVWISAGTALVEIDPVRLRILSVAPDVLPPEMSPTP